MTENKKPGLAGLKQIRENIRKIDTDAELVSVKDEISKIEKGQFPSPDELYKVIESSSIEKRIKLLSAIVKRSCEFSDCINENEIDITKIKDLPTQRELLVSSENPNPNPNPQVFRREILNPDGSSTGEIQIIVVTPFKDNEKPSVITYNARAKTDQVSDGILSVDLNNEDGLTVLCEINDLFNTAKDKFVEEDFFKRMIGAGKRFGVNILNRLRRVERENWSVYASREYLERALIAGKITSTQFLKLFKDNYRVDYRTYTQTYDKIQPSALTKTAEIAQKREEMLVMVTTNYEELREAVDKRRNEIVNKTEEEKRAQDEKNKTEILENTALRDLIEKLVKPEEIYSDSSKEIKISNSIKEFLKRFGHANAEEQLKDLFNFITDRDYKHLIKMLDGFVKKDMSEQNDLIESFNMIADSLIERYPDKQNSLHQSFKRVFDNMIKNYSDNVEDFDEFFGNSFRYNEDKDKFELPLDITNVELDNLIKLFPYSTIAMLAKTEKNRRRSRIRKGKKTTTTT